MNHGSIRRHLHEVEALDEPPQDRELPAQLGAASARSRRLDVLRAVGIPSRERIVEVVEDRAAGQHELPACCR